MRNHGIWMLIGCILPLILIFVLPLFGVSSGFSIFLFIVLMFACHLFMMRGHDHKHSNHQEHEQQHSSHDDGKNQKSEHKHCC